jgi:hypothetical protein
VRHNRNEFGALEPGETATAMEDRLRFHTDSWHLSVDLKAGLAAIVVIDARSRDAYIVSWASRSPAYPCFRSSLMQRAFKRGHCPASLRNARWSNGK